MAQTNHSPKGGAGRGGGQAGAPPFPPVHLLPCRATRCASPAPTSTSLAMMSRVTRCLSRSLGTRWPCDMGHEISHTGIWSKHQQSHRGVLGPSAARQGAGPCGPPPWGQLGRGKSLAQRDPRRAVPQCRAGCPRGLSLCSPGQRSDLGRTCPLVGGGESPWVGGVRYGALLPLLPPGEAARGASQGGPACGSQVREAEFPGPQSAVTQHRRWGRGHQRPHLSGDPEARTGSLAQLTAGLSCAHQVLERPLEFLAMK